MKLTRIIRTERIGRCHAKEIIRIIRFIRCCGKGSLRLNLKATYLPIDFPAKDFSKELSKELLQMERACALGKNEWIYKPSLYTT